MSNAVKSNSPLVSVVIPAYNAAAYLETACRAIQAQTYQNFEVVILDDGSTDETVSVLSTIAKDARFRIRSWTPNRGLTAALKEVIAMGRGKYWVSPGADDVILPEFLERRVALMEAHPEAGLVFGPTQLIDEAGNKIENKYHQWDAPERLDAKRALGMLLQMNFLTQPSTMVRSDVTRKVLPYFQGNWIYAPDWHLWILHLAAGVELFWDKQVLVQYRMHSNSLTGSGTFHAARRAEFRLVPLCALREATQFSKLAADEWLEWGPTLYRLWLWRAFKLQCRGLLKKQWIGVAGEAYYGKGGRPLSLLGEYCRHGPAVGWAVIRQFHTMRKHYAGIPIWG